MPCSRLLNEPLDPSAASRSNSGERPRAAQSVEQRSAASGVTVGALGNVFFSLSERKTRLAIPPSGKREYHQDYHLKHGGSCALPTR